MFASMVTDDEEDELNFVNGGSFNFHTNGDQRRPQLMSYEEHNLEEDCSEEGGEDLYQQLAEKDHYLMLAAEAGKVLLEKNQELTDHYESLHGEYMKKIEELEQEKHRLRLELAGRENTYESRMQDLQYEVTSLSGKLNEVQKSSKSFEKSHRSTYDDLSVQNNSLMQELSDLKLCNNGLMEQVQTLSKRIDARSTNNEVNHNNNNLSRNGYYSDHDGVDGMDTNESSNHREMKKLRAQLRELEEHKQFLEESLNELVQEKEALTNTQKRSANKIYVLEDEVTSLRQQMGMCKDDLDKSRRKNVQLKDQLEEYVLLQQSSQMHGSTINNSLFSELEMSLSEADMNFQNMNSTPLKPPMMNLDETVDDDIPQVLVSNNIDTEKLKDHLADIYRKVFRLKNQLSDEDDDLPEYSTNEIVNNTSVIVKLVDDVIMLIRERVFSLGAIDARSESPSRLDLECDDVVSQADSHISDRDVDILEQQVHDLNQRLNIATSELDVLKKELIVSQTQARDNEEKAQTLSVKSNSQEREIENLRKERDLMLADTSMEEKLKLALEERDGALQRENQAMSKLEQMQNDMQKLNNQLIVAVQQKLVLSEQLEEWQFDMASLIDQQLKSKIKREQQTTRKRVSTASLNKPSFFASKFFSSRNASKDSSRSNTPTFKTSPNTKK